MLKKQISTSVWSAWHPKGMVKIYNIVALTISISVFRTHAPFCYALSLVVSGTFFARKMRDARYLTMIDPFTQKYGKWGALQELFS